MHQPERFNWQVHVHGDAVHLVVAGDLDHATAAAFAAAFRDVLTSRPAAVVVDATAVPFISSEGAAALL